MLACKVGPRSETILSEQNNKPRSRRSTEQVREEILRAAEAEYSRYGFSGATTAAIAAGAKTTETQIFRYFSSKAELFREAIQRPLDNHLKNFMSQAFADMGDEASLEGHARSYIEELQDFISAHHRMFLSLIMAETGKRGEVQGMAGIDALHDYFSRGAEVVRERTGGADKLPPELMVRISFASLLGCVLFKDWLYPEGMADEEVLRQATTRFVMDGIYSDPV